MTTEPAPPQDRPIERSPQVARLALVLLSGATALPLVYFFVRTGSDQREALIWLLILAGTAIALGLFYLLRRSVSEATRA
ncbi:MAG TPA: hypothetical protein VF434_10020, partial [Promineifilum sp.]